MFDNRFRPVLGRLHLTFCLGGKLIAYAYIRKNACSSFKAAMGYDHTERIRRVFTAHPWQPWRRHDATIFVWRDPLERAVSTFQNNILDGPEGADILRDYAKVMGESPTTFERFAEYTFAARDPHCLPQASHLMPVRYTHAIPIGQLHRQMCDMVGVEAAAPFAVRWNRSEPREVEVSDRARALIRERYARDYDLISGL